MNSQLIKWDSSYSVGIENIDDQHKSLIEILNKLFASFTEGKANEIIPDIIDELSEYTIYHFKTEEEFFIKHNYPKADEHILKHKEFVKQVGEWKIKLRKSNEEVHYECISFLKNWLTEHIKGDDFAYSKYIESNN